MAAQPVIAVFDVGKTNKKLLLFNQQYDVVHEETARFAETCDEDGVPCEDLDGLRTYLRNTLENLFQNKEYAIKAVNIAAYGASFVHIDVAGKPVTPLYNYLKPYPLHLQQQLHDRYCGAEAFAVATASPVLGSLNSGLQLYRIKNEQPQVFQKIKHALHLPQYLSFLISGQPYSDITSIGCHTALWDFEKMHYHHWVAEEGLLTKLAPIHPTDGVVATLGYNGRCVVGVGVHDSSAALIPYQVQTSQPFILLSTGTWCITLNPFNSAPLTANELAQDCLCYMDYKNQPVKAARLFLGPQYDEGVARIAAFFNQDASRYRHLPFDKYLLGRIGQNRTWGFEKVAFSACDISIFKSDAEAYAALMLHLTYQQYKSTTLVLNAGIRQLYVDGGFSKNSWFMSLLASFFPAHQVYAASMAQGTALGAALALHQSWTKTDIPSNLVQLQYYRALPELGLNALDLSKPV